MGDERADVDGPESGPSTTAAPRSAGKGRDAGGGFRLGGLLEERGDLAGAEEVDPRGEGLSASRLGTHLEHNGDVANGEAAHRHAHDPGDGAGALRLGILEQRGEASDAGASDVAAESALRYGYEVRQGDGLPQDDGLFGERRDAPGPLAGGSEPGAPSPEEAAQGQEAPGQARSQDRHPRAVPPEGADAALERGMRLKARGEAAAAEEAFRRADEMGHATGAFYLGGLLAERGDPSGAEEAYRRADARGHPPAASDLGVLLEERGDLNGAEAAYRRADERGDPAGALNLACLLGERGDLNGAEAAFRRADERGDGVAASNLGVLLEQRGDLEGAEAAYRRADERGDAAGTVNLGHMLAERGDFTGAEAAYRRAVEMGPGQVSEIAREALSDLRASAQHHYGDDRGTDDAASAEETIDG